MTWTKCQLPLAPAFFTQCCLIGLLVPFLGWGNQNPQWTRTKSLVIQPKLCLDLIFENDAYSIRYDQSLLRNSSRPYGTNASKEPLVKTGLKPGFAGFTALQSFD
uniref:uncharacterized protein LOC128929922 isoform X2 n=1 Tax=Callithrix jacchus TaxID=9483 RepID=UPI0023DD0D04|nr:uncharacterized protein LOC128929922 isoform X2 [Callithrix jacchus]